MSPFDGKKASRLVVNADTIRALKAIADGRAEDRQLHRTSLRNFFQQAGFDTQGELVLLAPKQDLIYEDKA